jgi:hypothetical protein
LEKGRFALRAGFSGALKAIPFDRYFHGGKQRPLFGEERCIS